MKVYQRTIEDLIENEDTVDNGCPIPLEVIPNNMGINLCSVDSLSWQKQEDGQLVNLTIYFKPSAD